MVRLSTGSTIYIYTGWFILISLKIQQFKEKDFKLIMKIVTVFFITFPCFITMKHHMMNILQVLSNVIQ